MGNKIFIIGFMGSGKSHWGKIWGDVSGIDFFDLDKMIEKGEGKSVADIFRNDGEDHFRALETKYLKSFEPRNNFILSCGGGVPCFNDNMDWMNEQGVTVYLKVPAAILVQRIMDDKTDRPLITEKDPGKLIGFVEEMLEKRELFYSRAQFIFKEEELNEKIIERCLM